MEIITMNLAANETKQFRKAGSYIEILSSIGAIGVNLYTSNGGQTDSIKGGLSGLYMRSDFGAFDVQEQSGAAQTVQLLVCDAGEDGGSRRQPGIVSITNRISASVRAIFGAGNVALGLNATQIIAPAAAPNGILIRRAGVNITGSAGTTSGEARIISAPVMPTSTVPNISYQIAGTAVVGATSGNDSRNDVNYILPPGWGIWLLNSIAGAAVASTGYELTLEIL